MRKISIVMTYYDRKEQLNRTLLSLKQSAHDNFNVIIVDDASPKKLIINRDYGYKIDVINVKDKNWSNPDIAYNIGLNFAIKEYNTEIVIIQNAECCHVGDVIKYCENITDNDYISFGCYSLAKGETPSNVSMNHQGMTFDGESAWYNHPVFRIMPFDYCSAITAKNMVKLNGYDELFSFGYGYGDDYLLYRIRLLGLKIEIPSNPFVFHQWHNNRFKKAVNCKQYLTEPNTKRYNFNQKIYELLTKENTVRANHFYTENL